MLNVRGWASGDQYSLDGQGGQMRKILTIGGAGAVLALIGGFLFMQWAERQVLAEVDRQFVSSLAQFPLP